MTEEAEEINNNDSVSSEIADSSLGKRGRESETDTQSVEEEQVAVKRSTSENSAGNSTNSAVEALSETKNLLNQYIEKSNAESLMKMAQSLVSGSTQSTSTPQPQPIQPQPIQPQPSSIMKGENSSGETLIEVSPDKVGSIIGAKGTVIQEIQSKSGAKVHVDQNFPDGVNRVVKITGTPAQVKAAVEYVIKVVEEGPASIHVMPVQGAQCTTIIECPQTLVGRVIGSSGSTVKEIQQRTNVKIVIDQNFPEGVPRKITVTGNHQSVANATGLINYTMQHGPGLPPLPQAYGAPAAAPSMYGMNPYASTLGRPSAPNPYQPQAAYQPQQPANPYAPTSYMPPPMPQSSYVGGSDHKIMEVAKQYVGRIIGKGGSHVVIIGKQTGCQIRIDQDRDPCRVNITGSPTGIAQAEKMIQDVMMNQKYPALTMEDAAASAASTPSYGAMMSSYYSVAPAQQPSPYGQYQAPSTAMPAGYPYNPAASMPNPYAAASPYASASSIPNPYAQPAKPPSAWTEYKTDDGRSYWHNPSTGVTQWERPK